MNRLQYERDFLVGAMRDLASGNFLTALHAQNYAALTLVSLGLSPGAVSSGGGDNKQPGAPPRQ
jgi:hypothetical protein